MNVGERTPKITTRPGYKTRMCKFYQRGCCNRGNDCWFAHCSSELRQAVPSPKMDYPWADYFQIWQMTPVVLVVWPTPLLPLPPPPPRWLATQSTPTSNETANEKFPEDSAKMKTRPDEPIVGSDGVSKEGEALESTALSVFRYVF